MQRQATLTLHMLTDHSSDSIVPLSPLLSTEAAAAYLQSHPRTLAEWRLVGNGPKYVRVGRRAFYRKADLVAWLDAHVFERTSHEHDVVESSRRDLPVSAGVQP